MRNDVLSFPPEVEKQLRRQLRSQLLANKVPPENADQVVDLSFHAQASACRAMIETLGRISDAPTYQCAMGVTAGLIKAQMNMVEDAMREFAKATGAHSGEIKLTSQGVHRNG